MRNKQKITQSIESRDREKKQVHSMLLWYKRLVGMCYLTKTLNSRRNQEIPLNKNDTAPSGAPQEEQLVALHEIRRLSKEMCRGLKDEEKKAFLSYISSNPLRNDTMTTGHQQQQSRADLMDSDGLDFHLTGWVIRSCGGIGR
jgi:hypothetical protein